MTSPVGSPLAENVIGSPSGWDAVTGNETTSSTSPAWLGMAVITGEPGSTTVQVKTACPSSVPSLAMAVTV